MLAVGGTSKGSQRLRAAGRAGQRADVPAVLQHATRKAIYDLIRSRWGLCEADLGRVMNLGRNNIKYHLQRLSGAKLIHGLPQGRKIHFFPSEARLVDLQRAIGSAQNATRREIVAHLRARPDISWRAISRVLGVTPRAVRWHIQNMEGLGLLEIERAGMYCRVAVAPALAAVLDATGDGVKLPGPAPAFQLLEGYALQARPPQGPSDLGMLAPLPSSQQPASPGPAFGRL